MDFLKKFDLTGGQFMKLIALVVIVLIALVALTSIFSGLSIGSSYSSLPNMPASESSGKRSGGIAADSDGMMQQEMMVSESVGNFGKSQRPTVPNEGREPVPGSDAEAFEVKEYQATIESRNATRDCNAVHDLKARAEVVFEDSSETDRGCNYAFKVENKSVAEVLAVIESLNPKDLTERAFTIKRQITNYTSEVEILENKLHSINTTLESAVASYDNITALATGIEDVESLAKIIDSKISIIERLTNERIRTSSQLDRISRTKSEQLDRLAYAYFSVDIRENKFIDGEQLKHSWKMSVQRFVKDVNGIAQDLTLGLASMLLLVVQLAVYFFLFLVIARIGWGATKKIWGSKPQ